MKEHDADLPNAREALLASDGDFVQEERWSAKDRMFLAPAIGLLMVSRLILKY